MGYTTRFNGNFKLDNQLSLGDFRFLKKLGEDYEIDRSCNQPDSYCQWVPTENGWGIEWNKGEKFRKYGEWLQWIVDQILTPKGYNLTGSVTYQGEDIGDSGVLSVIGGKVIARKYNPNDDDVATLIAKAIEVAVENDEYFTLGILKVIAEKMDISIE